MATLRLQPHLMASPGRMSVEPWFRRSGPSVEPLTNTLRDWDSSLGLDVGFETTVDLAGVLTDAGLAEDALVAVYAVLDCPAGQFRTSVREVLGLGPSRVTVQLSIGPGILSSEVVLARGLVLLDPGTDQGGRQARSAGARLLDAPSHRLVLDSDGARFPVQSVDFSAFNLPAAAWMVTVDMESPADPFLASVRLLLNNDHLAVKLLEEGEPAERKLVASALRVDTIRQLFASAANDMRFNDGPFPDNSVGAMLEMMARDQLAMSLGAALELLRRNPDRFDAEVQARLNYLGGPR